MQDYVKPAALHYWPIYIHSLAPTKLKGCIISCNPVLDQLNGPPPTLYKQISIDKRLIGLGKAKSFIT